LNNPLNTSSHTFQMKEDIWL